MPRVSWNRPVHQGDAAVVDAEWSTHAICRQDLLGEFVRALTIAIDGGDRDFCSARS
jgi:hypothetical protein